MPNEIEKIFSRDNRRLAMARKVRDGKDRERIFIEGRRLAGEALRSELVIEEAFVAEGFRDRELVERISQRMDRVSEISARLFLSIADTDQPQGIALIARRPTSPLSSIEARLAENSLPVVVFLSRIGDPSNLGAVFRTAEAAGAAGVIISPNSADAYSPKASRAAMGASFRLAIVEETALEDALDWANRKGIIPVATAAATTQEYTELDWQKPRLIVFGSEAHGLDSGDLKLIGDAICIPLENSVESLNLAVSAGIILFEAKRQFDAGRVRA